LDSPVETGERREERKALEVIHCAFSGLFFQDFSRGRAWAWFRN
jgi:hypothetical protein